jgi:8-oxo-dGTP pyrophosphatase MutT (NUDIX family)
MPHIHEKIDFTASVFVVNDEKVLLRKHDKFQIWLGVGGHIELDENPNQAAIREVKEEVGLEVELISSKEIPKYDLSNFTELIPPEYMNFHTINEEHCHCDMVFFAISKTNQVITEGEKDEWKWFTSSQLVENKEEIKADVIFYAKQALKLAYEKK